MSYFSELISSALKGLGHDVQRPGTKGRYKGQVFSIINKGALDVEDIIRDLSVENQAIFNSGVEDIGLQIQASAREKILSGDASWQALAEHPTIRRKGHSKIFIETFLYYKSIQVNVDGASTFRMMGRGSRSVDFTVSVDIDPSASYSGSRYGKTIPVTTVAGYLEHGTSRMVARKLWSKLEIEAEDLVRKFNPFKGLSAGDWKGRGLRKRKVRSITHRTNIPRRP
tara:strand:- start:1618 stop:2295 length:678 start_codon:yes stop_codon:yes gene_type:complete